MKTRLILLALIAAQKARINRLEARLRHETLERKAAIAMTKAQQTQAQITYQRNQTLQQEGAVSNQELDLAQEKLDMISLYALYFVVNKEYEGGINGFERSLLLIKER